MTSTSPEHDDSSRDPGRTGPSESSAVPRSGRSTPRDSTSGPSTGTSNDKATTSGTSTGKPTSSGTSKATTSGPSSGTKASASTGTTKGRKSGTAAASGGDWNVFRTVVVLVGIVIAGFGAYYLILGSAGLPETPAGPVNPTLESQFRFFSAMMIGVGAAFITIAIKFQWANMLWLVCLMVFVGGIGRVLSWAFSGTPHYTMIVLMVIELAFPPALVVWHKYIAKTSDLRREFAQRD